MTEARANEIFKTKYPNGSILRKNSTSAGNKYWVVFDENSKAYFYSATSYAELLRRLKFNVIYKHDLNNAEANVERYTKQLEDLNNGIKPGLLLIPIEDYIESVKESLADAQKTLQYYQNECIVD